MNFQKGAIHLFRLAGIDVYLHWFWFLLAAYEIESRNSRYSSVVWSALEYLALFVIVLTHEFGHALACRSVGGSADQILLWPLGGVAYVNPPQRPGAMLWSIAAGPLVNVALLPLLWAAGMWGRSAGLAESMPDAMMLLRSVFYINAGLLAFNILPIYPLDGGQILRSLLWFVLGRARSLLLTTVLGFVGIIAFFGLALLWRSVWLAVLGIYMTTMCWGGLQRARALLKIEKIPRRQGFACPSCKTAPPIGEYWKCGQCQQSFDTFGSGGVCPNCKAQYPLTTCLDCRRQYPMNEWVPGSVAGVGTLGSVYPAK